MKLPSSSCLASCSIHSSLHACAAAACRLHQTRCSTFTTAPLQKNHSTKQGGGGLHPRHPRRQLALRAGEHLAEKNTSTALEGMFSGHVLLLGHFWGHMDLQQSASCCDGEPGSLLYTFLNIPACNWITRLVHKQGAQASAHTHTHTHTKQSEDACR